MKSISIITPCRNEEENVEGIYEAVRAAMAQVGRYRYEHIFIDNASTDRTVELIKRLAAKDRNVKLLVNTRNFGQVGSPMYALTQTRGDAVIGIVADFQDPPELIPEMIAAWEQGYPMVLCIKRTSAESPLMFFLRKRYYRLIENLSSVETFENFTGFGLYDRKVVDHVLALGDADHGQVEQRQEVVLALAAPAHRLVVEDLLMPIAEFGDHAAEVGFGIAER